MTIKIAKKFYRWTMTYISSSIEIYMYIQTERYDLCKSQLNLNIITTCIYIYILYGKMLVYIITIHVHLYIHWIYDLEEFCIFLCHFYMTSLPITWIHVHMCVYSERKRDSLIRKRANSNWTLKNDFLSIDFNLTGEYLWQPM